MGNIHSNKLIAAVPEVIAKNNTDPMYGPSLLFFSGGEAISGLSRALPEFTLNSTYIVPISDDGGSSREILDNFGGPAIGDIRKRLTDIAGDNSVEGKAVVRLLRYRLTRSEEDARREWDIILPGTHKLWKNISEAYKEIIRSDLVYFDAMVKHRAPGFRFAGGSIGNFFFSGARTRLNSLEAAIFLFSRVAMIKNTQVIPVINNNHPITLAAELQNGKIIRGQNSISHPGDIVNKNDRSWLESPIKRIFYIDQENKEVFPSINPHVTAALDSTDTIIYSMGSFYTSLMPNLILPGVGAAIAQKTGSKIYILNTRYDRETNGMNFKDFIDKITSALNSRNLAHPPSAYITHVFYPQEGEIKIDHSLLGRWGVKALAVPTMTPKSSGQLIYDPRDLAERLLAVTSASAGAGGEGRGTRDVLI